MITTLPGGRAPHHRRANDANQLQPVTVCAKTDRIPRKSQRIPRYDFVGSARAPECHASVRLFPAETLSHKDLLPLIKQIDCRSDLIQTLLTARSVLVGNGTHAEDLDGVAHFRRDVDVCRVLADLVGRQVPAPHCFTRFLSLPAHFSLSVTHADFAEAEG